VPGVKAQSSLLLEHARSRMILVWGREWLVANQAAAAELERPRELWRQRQDLRQGGGRAS
jgi:hypothetical protein